jgi:regulatory protein
MRHDVPDPSEKAREQALRLLRVRARSVSELRQRLMKYGHAPTVVDQVIARLTAVGLLDDHRFALDRATYLSQQRGQGPRKVRAALSRWGIAAETIDTAITHAYQNISADHMMRDILRRRFGERVLAVGADPKLRAKAQRFLLSRGFEPDSVFALLGFHRADT